MITCNLQGGLGNQMFQIAAAYAYGKRHNIESVFDLSKCYTPLQGNTAIRYTNTILKKVLTSNVNTIYDHKWVELGHGYRKIPKLNGKILLHGYFQSDKYFNDFKNDIVNLFQFPEDINSNINKFIKDRFEDTVTAVHVRRGDYLNNLDIHPTCNIEYYKKAMEEIGEGQFIFISDDIKWCKENFKGDNIHYSPFSYELEDLCLISGCDNQIIANSTFSWWGAYLCPWDNNKVIAPKLWFGKRGPQEQGDIIPNNWIKF
tara:strand:+ start:1739 stop:2515 length:777 start_codon:yes stop_codon:yes gene_type:complete